MGAILDALSRLALGAFCVPDEVAKERGIRPESTTAFAPKFVANTVRALTPG
jgi:hypothetical protein